MLEADVDGMVVEVELCCQHNYFFFFFYFALLQNAIW